VTTASNTVIHGKLGRFDPIGCFDGKDPHVSLHKLAGVPNLNIKRASDVLSVQLIGSVALSASVTNGLNKSAGHKSLWCVRGHQNTADCRPHGAVFVFGNQLHLFEKFLIGLGGDNGPELVP